MTKNIGNTDKIVRIILAAVIAVLIITVAMSSTLKIILGILAIILVVTSAIGTCTVYIPFKFSTKEKKTQ